MATMSTDLGWSLAVVLRRWQEAADHALSDVPGDTRCFHVLAAVADDDCMTQTELAKRTAVDRTVLTYLVDTLATAGLVERRTVPQDRRARHVVATSAGRRLLETARKRLADIDEHVLPGLSAPDRAAFHQLAAAAADSVVRADPGIDPCIAARGVRGQGAMVGEDAGVGVEVAVGVEVGVDVAVGVGATSSTPRTSATTATSSASSSAGGTRPRRSVTT